MDTVKTKRAPDDRGRLAPRWRAFATIGRKAIAACSLAAIAAPAGAVAPPVYDHVVVVVMENRSYNQIIGSASAPYINSLATEGALFTQSFGVTHPSQPNYLELFSGSAQGVTDNSCPVDFVGKDNLGAQLTAAALSFAGYSENLPIATPTACSADSTRYARKHNPWVDFDNVPASSNQAFSAFPSDFSTLPTVAFVVPNQCNDMHGISVTCDSNLIANGDAWVHDNLDAYVQWAKSHNSLFILTFDEDDGSHSNQIATIFVGPLVIPGEYSESITHHTVLATIEAMYGLDPINGAATKTPIADVWDTTVFRDDFEPHAPAL